MLFSINIELNKSTSDEIKNNFVVISSNKNIYMSGYHDFHLNVRTKDIKSLSHITATTNENDIVESVIFHLSNSDFEQIYDILATSYKVIKSDINNNHKHIMFDNKDKLVFLYILEQSNTMQIQYATKNYMTKIKKI